MAKFDEKSILKTKEITKVLLNHKDYTFLDFKFKIIEREQSWAIEHGFNVEVSNFDKWILKISVSYVYDWVMNDKKKTMEVLKDKFRFHVLSFNPQTNNDIQSINHIIATFKDMVPDDEKYTDRGNCAVLNNEYIFRKKDNFYTYTRIWKKGEIKEDNFDVDLSHEFATNEYISFVKKLFGFKIIQRRTLKKEIKQAITKACIREKKKKIFEKL